MSARRLGFVSAAVVVGALMLVGAAAGSVHLHTGSTKYLRIVQLRGGNRTMVLTGRGRRALKGQLKGRVLVATCAKLGRAVHGFTITSEQSESENGPPGRLATYHSMLVPGTDFCAISLQRLNSHGSTGSSNVAPPFDSIALNQNGAAYLNEDRVTQRLFGVLQLATELASKDPHGDYPTATRLMAFLHGQLTTLNSPNASPPVGRVGVFSDGAGHIQIAALSPPGKRLYIDSNAAVLSTNAPEHLIRVVGRQVDTLPS
jgi:hypothetical protein